jgi:hypothetical protein
MRTFFRVVSGLDNTLPNIQVYTGYKMGEYQILYIHPRPEKSVINIHYTTLQVPRGLVRILFRKIQRKGRI